jgi:putative pyrroloquinoline-quinone binding quinoprotein
MHAQAVIPRLAWKKKVEGYFAGSFLDVVRQYVVLLIGREGGSTPALWALQANGKTVWEHDFELDEIDHYFVCGESLFIDGVAAIRIGLDDGRILARKEFSERVSVRQPTLGLPVYIVGRAAIMGVDSQTLETVWEWPDSEFVAHDGRLCRFVDGSMRFVELPAMKEWSTPVREPLMLGYHAHCGDLWIHFEEKRRFGISTTTGEVVWCREEKEPDFHAQVFWTHDTAYCGGRAITAYDLRTGTIRWRQEVPGYPEDLRVSEGKLLAGTKSGLVYMLNAHTGEVLLRHDIKAKPTALALLPPNRIVVGTYKVIYCLEWS